jgi:hypothetical protein
VLFASRALKLQIMVGENKKAHTHNSTRRAAFHPEMHLFWYVQLRAVRAAGALLSGKER